MAKNDNMDINFNPDDLTVGELEEFEEISGMTLSGLGRGAGLSAKAMKAIIYLDQRRKNPKFTLEDAKAVKIGSLNWESDDDEGDETPLAEDNEPQGDEQ